MFDNDPGGKPKSAVKAMSARSGKRLYSIHAGDGDLSVLDDSVCRRTLDESVQCIELSGELGAMQVVFHPSGEPIPPEQRSLRLERTKASLATLAPTAALGRPDRGGAPAEDLPRQQGRRPRRCLPKETDTFSLRQAVDGEVKRFCQLRLTA